MDLSNGIEKSVRAIKFYAEVLEASGKVNLSGTKSKTDYLLAIKKIERSYSKYSMRPMAAKETYKFIMNKILQEKSIAIPTTDEEADDEEEQVMTMFTGEMEDLEDSVKNFTEFIETIEKGIQILSAGPEENFEEWYFLLKVKTSSRIQH